MKKSLPKQTNQISDFTILAFFILAAMSFVALVAGISYLISWILL